MSHLFCCAVQVPRELFEFVIQSFGGKVGWDGEGSKIKPDDASITHVVIDRPTVSNAVAGREYVQPQWVIDSANAIFLLPASKYSPGADLPVRTLTMSMLSSLLPVDGSHHGVCVWCSLTCRRLWTIPPRATCHSTANSWSSCARLRP